jgi:hypothetical protein
MEEHSAPANVLCDGIEDTVKLPGGNRLTILDGKVEVVDAPALALDANLGQRYDRRDAMGIAFREFFGVG